LRRKNHIDSLEQSSLKEKLTPFLAIVHADLASLFKSKITYGWLFGAIFLQVIRVLGTSLFNTTSIIITEGLSDFIYIWSMLIIGLAASAVASETGVIADSIMSKSITRYDYILAKFSSRIIHTMVLYSAITAVLVGSSIRMANNDYEIYGLIASILLVALTLIMLTVLGVTLSTVISNTVIAIVTLLVLWYSMTFFFPILDLEFVSPSNLITQLPDIIKGVWNGEEWKTAVGFTSISLASIVLSTLYFSKKDL
jgi:ABC-2 type transport system permease protein